jgi:hypothetical protein
LTGPVNDGTELVSTHGLTGIAQTAKLGSVYLIRQML